MSCFQSDAWCHQTKLKRQRYGQVTVILAANIIPILGVRYMKNKICIVSFKEVFSSKVDFHKSHNLRELTTYFTGRTSVMSLTPSFTFV